MDSSGPMNILAERLLKGAYTHAHMHAHASNSILGGFLLDSCSKSTVYKVCVWGNVFGAGDEERGEPHIKQVYFRQFLPVSPKVK